MSLKSPPKYGWQHSKELHLLEQPAGAPGSLPIGECPLARSYCSNDLGTSLVNPVSVRSFLALVGFLCFLSPGVASLEKQCLTMESSYTT